MLLYYLFSLLTAPGVIVHELSHGFFCILAGVRIHKMKIFQFGNPAGYVTHDLPDQFHQSLLISCGPLLINSLFALILFSLVRPPYLSIQPWVMLWLGLAVGLHAIPSDGDASSLLSAIHHRWWHNPLKILAYPLVATLYILNFLRRFHLDFVYVAALFWIGDVLLKK